MQPASRPRRPRNTLTLDAILDAAERVATGGASQLTIRAVADDLGASAMGLYRYVASKDELVDALLDRVLGRMRFAADTDDPLSDLDTFARDHRALLMAHPWAVPALITRPVPGSNAIPIGEWALHILARAGIEGDRAVAVFSGVIALNYGAAAFTLAREQPDASASLERVATGPDARFPLTAAATGSMMDFGSDRHYEMVLAVLHAGLRASAG